jgi:hypothetical protein
LRCSMLVYQYRVGYIPCHHDLVPKSPARKRYRVSPQIERQRLHQVIEPRKRRRPLSDRLDRVKSPILVSLRLHRMMSRDINGLTPGPINPLGSGIPSQGSQAEACCRARRQSCSKQQGRVASRPHHHPVSSGTRIKEARRRNKLLLELIKDVMARRLLAEMPGDIEQHDYVTSCTSVVINYLG